MCRRMAGRAAMRAAWIDACIRELRALNAVDLKLHEAACRRFARDWGEHHERVATMQRVAHPGRRRWTRVRRAVTATLAKATSFLKKNSG